MIDGLPRAWGSPPARARLRHVPEDFVVEEVLDFCPEGNGEHVFLKIRKRDLSTPDLVQRIATVAGVPRRDVGFSGLKDRSAITTQWLSVHLPGREVDWETLHPDPDIDLLAAARHPRKLRRGVHRCNRFSLRLRDLAGDRGAIEARLQQIAGSGFPNYFGEQRFGHHGSTLRQAQAWARGERRPRARRQRSLWLSALRSSLFNRLLAQRLAVGTWPLAQRPGAMWQLQGSRSLFYDDGTDASLEARLAAGDLHPALPLWGRGERRESADEQQRQDEVLRDEPAVLDLLERESLALGYRAARVIPDDFAWNFCEDDALDLVFSLPAGAYATALVRELADTSTGGDYTS